MNISHEFYRIVSEEAAKPFQYGVNDCALMVDTVYRRAFNMDLAGDIRGSYNDEYHAAKVLVKLGGWDGILLSRGFTKVENHNFTNVGDIVICEGAAGVYVGDSKAIFAGGAHKPRKEFTAVYNHKG